MGAEQHAGVNRVGYDVARGALDVGHVGDTGPPRRIGLPATHGQGAELSQAMAVPTGPAVHSTAPTPRNSTCATPTTAQAAVDGGHGLGVVPDAHRRCPPVLEVQGREPTER